MRLQYPPTDHRLLWPEVSDGQWRDWRWQQRHAIGTLEQLEQRFPVAPEERRGLQATRTIFRLGITPYYASLMDPAQLWCPVRRQAIPLEAESHTRPEELADPLGEDPHRPVPSIVHKYPDRVLFLALDRCSIYCRHCTRRRLTGQEHTDLDRTSMEQGIAYVQAHPEVRDVLISGGDPFLLPTDKLATLLARLRAIPHVELIRIGTRMPVCNPFRVDAELARALRASEAWVVTHFNHPREVTAEARDACGTLVDHGVPVENQTVLLRRLNSDAAVIRELNHLLLRLRVRPYYLHQGDVAEGLDHLRTPVSAGIEIIRQLRGFTSGLAVPHLAVDLPAGGGKVAIGPDYIVERAADHTLFRNYRGELYRYPEPLDGDCSVPYVAPLRHEHATDEGPVATLPTDNRPIFPLRVLPTG